MVQLSGYKSGSSTVGLRMEKGLTVQHTIDVHSPRKAVRCRYHRTVFCGVEVDGILPNKGKCSAGSTSILCLLGACGWSGAVVSKSLELSASTLTGGGYRVGSQKKGCRGIGKC